MKKPHSCAGKVLVCLWLASFGIPRPAPAQTTSQAVTLCQQDRFAEATRILRTIIDNPSKPDQQRAEASTALSSCQQRLVGSWSSLVSFFTSAASRLQARSLTTFRSETIFQLTPDQESRMGDEAFAMLRTLVRPASDPEAESFVRQITSRLVSASPGLAGNVQVALIDTQDIAAPSLPGKVVATTALLRFAASETDLAAAIAHDLGHAYAHHAARRLLSEMQQQALINRLVSAVTRHNDLLAKANTIIASSASKLISTAFGAAEESEADRYAEHLLFNAGYDPRALPKILEEMARSGSAGVRVPPDRALVAAGYASAFPPVPNKLRDDSAAFSQIKGRYQGSGPIPAPALAGAQPMESPAVTTPAVKATQPAESATPAAAAPAAAMRPTPSATVASAPPQPLPPPAHTSQPRVTQVPAQPAQPPPAAPTPASAGAPPQPPPVPAPPPAPVPPPATRTEPVAVPAVPSQPALLKPPAAVPAPASAPLSPSVVLPSPPPPVPAPSPATRTEPVAVPAVPS
ncbi:MAG: M48 family metalloprotease, partial [Acidobacteria bacterium]|nr:M48 family metalloprotease [Acidobacteriota bacterium]